MFEWIKKQHVSMEGSLETLYKDPKTGAKKWEIMQRTREHVGEKAKSRTEYYGPNDEGPFASETELRHNLKRILRNV